MLHLHQRRMLIAVDISTPNREAAPDGGAGAADLLATAGHGDGLGERKRNTRGQLTFLCPPANREPPRGIRRHPGAVTRPAPAGG